MSLGRQEGKQRPRGQSAPACSRELQIWIWSGRREACGHPGRECKAYAPSLTQQEFQHVLGTSMRHNSPGQALAILESPVDWFPTSAVRRMGDGVG